MYINERIFYIAKICKCVAFLSPSSSWLLKLSYTMVISRTTAARASYLDADQSEALWSSG